MHFHAIARAGGVAGALAADGGGGVIDEGDGEAGGLFAAEAAKVAAGDAAGEAEVVVVDLVVARAAAAFIEDEDAAVEAGELDGGGEAGGPTAEHERIVDKLGRHATSVAGRESRKAIRSGLFAMSCRGSSDLLAVRCWLPGATRGHADG